MTNFDIEIVNINRIGEKIDITSTENKKNIEEIVAHTINKILFG